MSLSSLVFSSQLQAPSVVSNYDLSSYNGFTKRFVQVESKGELFYIDTKNGYSVWESPSLILTILLANKIERDAFEPVRWFSVWKTPLIILLDHHNRKWTMNKINHRMIEGIPMEIIDHIDERVRVELKMLENKPQRDVVYHHNS